MSESARRNQTTSSSSASPSTGLAGGLPEPKKSNTGKRKGQGRGPQIGVACLPCQKRKCRCDGKRPTCSTCTDRGKQCEYDVEEGLSRIAHLRQANRVLEGQHGELHAMLDLLRTGSDQEAANALARLRMGDSITDILHETTQRHPQQMDTDDRYHDNGHSPYSPHPTYGDPPQGWNHPPQQ